jgi:hypothetical protein
MTLLDVVQVVYVFSPAYAADVSPIFAERLLPKFFLGAVAFVSLVHVPPLGIVCAVLPLVFVCDIAVTTMFWRLRLKQSWI